MKRRPAVSFSVQSEAFELFYKGKSVSQVEKELGIKYREANKYYKQFLGSQQKLKKDAKISQLKDWKTDREKAIEDLHSRLRGYYSMVLLVNLVRRFDFTVNEALFFSAGNSGFEYWDPAQKRALIDINIKLCHN